VETQQTVKERNQLFLSHLDTPGFEKKAVDAVNSFTRTKMREDSFSRKIMDPLQITNDELDRAVDTDKPVKVIDKENDNPPAISVPFANLPVNIYIMAPRYRVLFDRVLSPRFTKDVEELRTYVMDVRQVMSDNAIKDMLAEEDGKFLSAVNAALGAKDSIQPLSGVVQYQGIGGGITRETTLEATKIMPRTPFRLETHTILCNMITIKEVQKWGRDEMGGDFSQDIIRNGWAEENFMGYRWIITIKRDLVPDDTFYMFSEQKFIGKSFVLEDCTMFIKREAFMLEFFCYETMGGAIGHIGGLARCDFE
jgi:hypothetical protein